MWTIIQGEMYVSCYLGCLPLPLEGLVPPPDSPELRAPGDADGAGGTDEQGGGKGTPEGSDADGSREEEYELPW